MPKRVSNVINRYPPMLEAEKTRMLSSLVVVKDAPVTVSGLAEPTW